MRISQHFWPKEGRFYWREKVTPIIRGYFFGASTRRTLTTHVFQGFYISYSPCSFHSTLIRVLMTKWPETEPVKKLSLEISQISQENAFARVSFLIKLQAKTCNFIRKETQAQMFSCEFCKNFKNTFFHRTHYDVVLLFLLLTLNIFCTFFLEFLLLTLNN